MNHITNAVPYYKLLYSAKLEVSFSDFYDEDLGKYKMAFTAAPRIPKEQDKIPDLSLEYNNPFCFNGADYLVSTKNKKTLSGL